MSLLILLLIPFMGALLCLGASCLFRDGRIAPAIAVLTALVAVIGLSSFSSEWKIDGEIPTFFTPWIPEIGLNVSLMLDGPALFYAWIVLGIGLLVFTYAAFYMDMKDAPFRFFGTMLFFQGAMLGVVLSHNIGLMFLFWELTSVSSFILIGHWHQKEEARAGALRALVVTGAGGLCLLAGVGALFYGMTVQGVPAVEALEWSTVWALGPQLIAPGSFGLLVLVLFLLGACTKSAQFPFHFWLPGAMEAPSPVSAFLHAATMVKAGIYLLGRMYPVFQEETAWLYIVGTTGVLTMVVGGWMAILSRDLKQLLAHSTVSQLGLLTAYYGFGHGMMDSDYPLPMDLMLVASHAFFKGALFLLVGVIDHGTHTRDWTKLGGLWRTMPVTAILCIIGAASMAGFPFTLGFVAKELFLKAAFRLETDMSLFRLGLPIIAVVASGFTAAYSLRVAISPFFGKPRDPEIHPHEGGPGLLLPPAILITLCAIGLWAPLIEQFIAPMIYAPAYKTSSGFTLAFFHHLDKYVAAAAVIWTLGIIFFLAYRQIDSLWKRLGEPTLFRSIYTLIFDKAIPDFAAGLTRILQRPELSNNLIVLVPAIFGTVAVAFLATGIRPQFAFQYHEVEVLMVVMLIITATLAMVVLRHRVLLFRVIAVSPIGLFVGVFFILFKAPDVALTQILVEMAMLIVLLLFVRRLPQAIASEKSSIRTGVRIAIASVAGLVLGMIAYTGGNSPWRNLQINESWPIPHEYYLDNSKYPLGAGDKYEAAELAPAAIEANYPGADNLRSGGGTNVVNVILVDFRGIDTLGEILVLGIAAFGVFVLMETRHRARHEKEKRTATGEINSLQDDLPEADLRRRAEYLTWTSWRGITPVFIQLVRIVPSMVMMLAAYLFWSGHNDPGGGFIAGLTASTAVMLYLLGFPEDKIKGLHRINWLLLVPFGMILALLTAITPAVLQLPILTSAFQYFPIPGVGELGLSTVIVFDLGVFFVVIGMTTLIMRLFRSG